MTDQPTTKPGDLVYEDTGAAAPLVYFDIRRRLRHHERFCHRGIDLCHTRILVPKLGSWLRAPR